MSASDPSDRRLSSSSVPGIAICGVIAIGSLSTLLAAAGFLCGLTLAGTTLKGTEAGPVLIGSAIMMAIAAANFAWLLHFCFRKI